MLGVLFLPLWSEVSPDGSETVNINAYSLVYTQGGLTDAEISTKPTWYISLAALFASGIAMFTIFKFRNRMTQMKLSAVNSLFIGATIGLIYFFSTRAEPIIANHQGEFEIGSYIAAAALFFNWLAKHFIQKDEKLVRSADRIR